MRPHENAASNLRYVPRHAANNRSVHDYAVVADANRSAFRDEYSAVANGAIRSDVHVA
ncbi:hypothetical protein THIX_110101 [Thiomonas sp. X19]|nr:hypothetical protein THIX_110101 [Thiomonas sp. X19]VDY05656.1 protein of unknown function [Thiomonas sp. Bio17B3]VDY13912.1 protein of unknown function [Thiomonas sp. OC7]